MSCCSKPEEKQQQGSCAPPAAAGAVTHEDVSKYYSENIQKTSDLVTAACCVSSTTSLPKRHRDVIKEIHPEVNDKFYGCGSTVPPMVDGCTVLDLGCGTGRDVFLASALVGKDGRAIGIDMTASQVEVATRHQQFHADKFLGEGSTPNTQFHHGKIEECSTRVGGPCAPGSVDAVISNCVVNLVPEKSAVLASAFEVLRPGGELYFSDIYASRRVPEALRGDKMLWGECLSGALYWNDFLALMRECGFVVVRKLAVSPVALDGSVEETCKAHGITFQSITVRAFKPSASVPAEPFEEDYGQTATLVADIDAKGQFALDENVTLTTGTAVRVSSNEAEALRASRYGTALKIDPLDKDAHRGPFCRRSAKDSAGSCCPPAKDDNAKSGSCCPPPAAKKCC